MYKYVKGLLNHQNTVVLGFDKKQMQSYFYNMIHPDQKFYFNDNVDGLEAWRLARNNREYYNYDI